MTTKFGEGYNQGLYNRLNANAAAANARAGEAAAERDRRDFKADRDDARALAEHRAEQNRLELLRIQNSGGGGTSPEEIEQIRQDNAVMSEQLQGLQAERANEYVTFGLEGYIQTGDFGYMERAFAKPGVKEALEEIGVSDMMPVDWENDGELLSSVGFSYAAMQNKKFRDAASREYFKYKKNGEWAISSVESTAMQFGVFKNFSKATNDQHTAGVAAIHAAFNGVDLEHEKKTKDAAAALANRTQDDVKTKNDQDNENTDEALAEAARTTDIDNQNIDEALNENIRQFNETDKNLDADRVETAKQADAALTQAAAALMNANTSAGKPSEPRTELARNVENAATSLSESYKALGVDDTASFFELDFNKNTAEGKANFEKSWPKLQAAELYLKKAPSDATRKDIKHIDIMADLGSKAAGLKSGQVGWIDAWLRSAKDATWFSSPEGKAAVTAYETLRNRNRHILYGSAVVAGEATYAKSELDDLTAQPAKVLVQLRGAMQNQLAGINSMVKTGHPQAMYARMATTVATLNDTIQYLTDRIDTLYPTSAKPKPEATPPLNQEQIDNMNAAGKRQPNAGGTR
ncbi:MAG: hypothetical protein K0U41_03765 [Gammaproteobacteria bacterium]|nr:hypothetical protein [Gammaproteobacteria bacterium]